MRSAVLLYIGTKYRRSNRGTVLIAAVSLAFLVFLLTAASVASVTRSYTHTIMRHHQTSALFLAEAGIRKAGQQLLQDRSYTGESKTRLAGGHFDVQVTRETGSYLVTSTGYADYPLERKPKKTVQATIRISGTNSFLITNWREDP